MSDGAISVKLAPDYEMGEVQQQLNDYDTSDDIISNDGFFPDMSLSQFRNQYRADGTITTQRLQDALIEGMASVNAELSTFKTQSKRDSLEQIIAPSINGESVLIYRYKRATALTMAKRKWRNSKTALMNYVVMLALRLATYWAENASMRS